MRKNYVKTSAILAAMVLMLGGCGTAYPELSAEDEALVAEYAAKLLLKYDANNRSRLVVRDELILAEDEEQPEEESIQEQEPEEDVSGEEAPIIEMEEEPQTTTDNMVGSPAEFYELGEGITINYQGMEVCDSYPSGGDAEAYFALDATEGKRLMVLKFTIENHSQSEQHVDLLSQDANLRITVNGGYTRNVLTTMLTDDMATYMGDISVGETVNVVLLAEADKDVADSISTLMLNLKNDSKTCTIQLK